MQKSVVAEWVSWASVSFEKLLKKEIVQTPLLAFNKRLRVIELGSYHGQTGSASNQRRNTR